MLKKLGNKNKNFGRSSTLNIPSKELTSSVFLRQSRRKFCNFSSSFGGLIQRENVNSSCIGSQVSLVSRTNRNASNWDNTPYGISNILCCCMLSKNVRDKTLSKQRPQVLSWVNCFQNTNQLGVMLFGYRVCTGHGKPGKSWNLRISFSRPGKSWNLIVGPGKSWKIKDLYNR